MGAFASDVAQLPRIVTLNDIAISNDKGTLTMEAVAKTFRYLDEEEIAKQRAAAKAGQGQGQEMKRAALLACVGCSRPARRLRRREPSGPAAPGCRSRARACAAARPAAAGQAVRAVRVQRIRPARSVQAAQDRADEGEREQARAGPERGARSRSRRSARVAEDGRHARAGQDTFALVQTPDKTSTRCVPGNYMGQNFGVIIGIDRRRHQAQGTRAGRRRRLDRAVEHAATAAGGSEDTGATENERDCVGHRSGWRALPLAERGSLALPARCVGGRRRRARADIATASSRSRCRAELPGTRSCGSR